MVGRPVLSGRRRRLHKSLRVQCRESLHLVLAALEDVGGGLPMLMLLLLPPPLQLQWKQEED